ncbi:hypothetical protein ACQKLX_08050 [Bosea sp. NPDC003192]|jgi:hypothetical protein|uniref:hypothetical protein n=1 Tax=Bosea sp. NPDC003192 TaxID=3390551 RepID=UPI003CFDFC73
MRPLSLDPISSLQLDTGATRDARQQRSEVEPKLRDYSRGNRLMSGPNRIDRYVLP